MKIWLDDIRPAPRGWYHCKTAKETILLLDNEYVTDISLDHDLGPKEAGTGYDVMLYMEEKLYVDSKIPPRILIHTDNPPARIKMEAARASIEIKLYDFFDSSKPE